MKTSQPYTYLLKDSETGKSYIGCRFAEGCNPSDLGVSYFTSSKIVEPLFRKNPTRFFKSIVFRGSTGQVIEFEKELIDSSNAVLSDDYYNRASGKAIHPDDIRAGALKEHAKRTPEMYALIVSKMHAKTTFEQRSKLANRNYNSMTPEQKSAKMAMMRASRTPEGLKRAAQASVNRARANPEKMSEMGKLGGKVGGPKGCLVTNSQKWKCVQCGMVSLPGPLGKHLSRSGHSGKERVS